MPLTALGQQVAVLAVDPSSTRTGGSILGDKTRMSRLSIDPDAFVRPSPSSGSLGGVARATREATLLCEAAGFETVLIETVGVGQSEVTVAGMVDFFLVLMLPGAGDDLQGIKKGILEIADMIVVNKADGANEIKAKQAARDYAMALHMMKPVSPNWTPPVEVCSAMRETGFDKIWENISLYYQKLGGNGELNSKQKNQQISWMWSMLESQLIDRLKSHPEVSKALPEIEDAVMASALTPVRAVERLLKSFAS
jgi:LAO/AO transport system kinase